MKIFYRALLVLAIWLIGYAMGKNHKPIEKLINSSSSDSIEYAVYSARPIDYPEDCEPVYIPLDMLSIAQSGDVVYIDTTTNILAPMPIRDAETRQPAGLYERVLLQKRVDHNKNLPLKH